MKKTINIGDRFGSIVILELDVERRGKNNRLILDKVQCDCGKIYNVYRGSYTRKDPRLMCKDCHNRINAKNNTKELNPGDIYGYLKILKPGNPKKSSDGWNRSTSICECLLCNSTCVVVNSRLKNRNTKSCGCLESNGEMLTQIELNKYNIETSRQYTFYDLKSSNGNLLRFDFAIHKNGELLALIEYQGSQHFSNSHGKFGEQQRNETDILKKEYCKTNNISFYEIKFDDDITEKVNYILTDLQLKGD